MILTLVFSALWSAGWCADWAAEYPGGAGTVADVSANAFGHPAQGATREERRQFFVGNSFFKDVWVRAPSSTSGRDGLGPTYNATSCSSCHVRDGRGVAYSGLATDVSLLFRLGNHPHYGGQLNPFGIEEGVAEGRVDVEFAPESIVVGQHRLTLRRPRFAFANLQFGPIEQTTQVSARVASQLIGLGLIEAVPSQQVLEWEDQNDRDQDGISGLARWVDQIGSAVPALGRFGWKAEQPTVRQQSAGAFLGDMGLTTSLFPVQNCPSVQLVCASLPEGGRPEVEDRILDRVTTYTQLLAVPKRRKFDDPEVKRGERIFHEVRCAACHRPSFTTGAADFEILRAQTIFPYSDLLLHDMGEELADSGQGWDRREWRTPPLWGVGLIPTVNGHQNLLHDGRARGVEEAILWHAGEGLASRQAYQSLSAEDRLALVEFVNSL